MEDIGSEIRDALEHTVGDAAKRRDEERELQQDCARLRFEAVSRLKGRWGDDRTARARRVERKVRAYGGLVADGLRGALARDARMPVSINYLERYAAMKSIQDRTVLLARIEQTIDLADEAVARARTIDPRRSLEDAAEALGEHMRKLSAVAVTSADAASASDELSLSDARESVLTSLADDAAAAFADEALAEGADDAGTPFPERLERYRQALSAAAERAEAAHRMRLAGLAQSAAGRSADLGEMPTFAGDATFSLRFDPDEVAELARLVRASFKTYASVVRDNRVFAAFSEGSLFGRCVGQASWLSVWDDWSMEEFDYDASEFLGAAGVREAVRSRIPSGVEEAEGDDDSLSVAIDRMRRFNARRYFGMLDDDFKQHVDAFWYGFGKLMEFADGLVDLDICGFQQHCDRVVEQAAARCGDLALLMDDAQLEAYCDEIDALADRLRR